MKKSWRFGRFDTMKGFIRCEADKWISFFWHDVYHYISEEDQLPVPIPILVFSLLFL